MIVTAADPGTKLALLPLDADEGMQRRWLQDTVAWLKSVPPATRADRLRRLAEDLGEPDQDLSLRFRRVWTQAFAPRLFSEAGLPESTSLQRELVRRIWGRFLPHVEYKLDLYATLQASALNDADADWILDLTKEDALRWAPLVGASREDLLIALRLLAIRAASIGLSADTMKVMPYRWEHESPFYILGDMVSRYATSTVHEDEAALEESVLECRMCAGVAHARLEEQGVSSDLVFGLDLVISQLDRMDVLLRLARGETDGRTFAALLVRGFTAERGIDELVRNSINRIALRIVEYTGKTGKHYIAEKRSDWWIMGRRAFGSGCITAFTALFKFALGALTLAPLWIGIAQSLNYAASFVLMQLLSWPLASKMPAMTAGALGHALDSEVGIDAEVRLAAAICRTQVVVTAGNLLGAIPMSLLVDFLIQSRNGHPFLGHEAALHGLESMHIFRSLTIPFAILTGCSLWISSLVAGWTANWMAVYQLPAALSGSRRVRRLLGDARAEGLGRMVGKHLSAVAGFTCLGFLLGFVPVASVFAGLPIEVRHITLAAASLGYAMGSLAFRGPIPWDAAFWAFLGLAATAVFNLTVSFALGLWLAARARRLNPTSRRALARALLREFRRHPGRFLWRHKGVGALV